MHTVFYSLDGNNPVDGLELWEGKTDNEWSGQVTRGSTLGYCFSYEKFGHIFGLR